MSDAQAELLRAFDGHDTDGVRAALSAGADVRSTIRGKLATDWLLEEYTRSDRLGECLQLLLDNGAPLADTLVGPVILDDADGIRRLAETETELVNHRTSLKSAFISLDRATLLHVAAEYGNLAAARTLIELGADVNATTPRDEHGLNGHTPLFHTVNSASNRSAPVMRLLVESGADCGHRLQGVHWGKGYEWHTIFFDVTPVSFAQAGLFPQVHRAETDVYDNVRYLIEAAGRPVPRFDNVPNRYLSVK